MIFLSRAANKPINLSKLELRWTPPPFQHFLLPAEQKQQGGLHGAAAFHAARGDFLFPYS